MGRDTALVTLVRNQGLLELPWAPVFRREHSNVKLSLSNWSIPVMLGYVWVFMPPCNNKCNMQIVSQAPSVIRIEKANLLREEQQSKFCAPSGPVWVVLPFLDVPALFLACFSAWNKGSRCSCSWAVAQLATHVCVEYFKETNGHNSSEFVPYAHAREPRTGGEMVTTKIPCVLLHVIIELYLDAGACQ